MRRFLLILLGLLGTAQPAVRAEAPFLSPRVGADSLSSLLASPEEPATFGIRFVACLADDDSLALIDVDDQTHDNESNSNQADGRDEQQRTESLVKPSARRDGHPATAGRIVEAVDSATSDDAVANAISPRDLKHAMSAVDDARVRARLAELNKPATLLTVAPPPVTAGDEPVNRAAVVFDQSPYWILGGPSVPRRHSGFTSCSTIIQHTSRNLTWSGAANLIVRVVVIYKISIPAFGLSVTRRSCRFA